MATFPNVPGGDDSGSEGSANNRTNPSITPKLDNLNDQLLNTGSQSSSKDNSTTTDPTLSNAPQNSSMNTQTRHTDMPIYSWLPSNPQARANYHSNGGSNHLEECDITDWANRYGVKLNGVEFVDLPNGMGKGIAAIRDFAADTEDRNFVEVPKSVILNIEHSWMTAEDDETLLEVLVECEPFSTFDRGAIILFLLVQMTRADLRVVNNEDIGPKSPWVEYVGWFLQNNTDMPTRWTANDRKGLFGTTLDRLADRKVEVLEGEYQSILAATHDIPWCHKYWIENDRLTFEDYCFADTVYRSRAMELNGLGNCLVPVMDMANHDDELNYIASYTFEDDTNCAEMSLEFGRYVVAGSAGTEVTINYGWDKTPADMLLSYGFFDDRPFAAGLDLYIPTDYPQFDPPTMIKQRALRLPPVVHIRAKPDSTFKFESALFKALVVTAEDGLRAEINEDDEPVVFFHDEEMTSAEDFMGKVAADSKSSTFSSRFDLVLKEFFEDIIRQREYLLTHPSTSSQRLRPVGISNNNWLKCEELRRQELECLRLSVQFLDRKLAHDQIDNESYPFIPNPSNDGSQSNTSKKTDNTSQLSTISQPSSSTKQNTSLPPTASQSSKTSHIIQPQSDNQSRTSGATQTTTASIPSASSTTTRTWQPYTPGLTDGNASWRSGSLSAQDSSISTAQSQSDDDVALLTAGIKRMRFSAEDRQRARDLVRQERFGELASSLPAEPGMGSGASGA